MFKRFLSLGIILTILVTFTGCQLFGKKPADTTTTPITTTKQATTTTTEQSVVLNTPKNVEIVYDYVIWDAVENAEAYLVTVNGESYHTESTNFDLAKLLLPDGEYTITVKAVKGTSQSAASATVTYDLNRTERKAALLSRVLSIVNPNYTPDLDKEDFDSPIEYGNYRKTLRYAEIYIDIVNESRVNFNDALETVQLLNTMLNVPPEDFADFQAVVERIAGFGFTSRDIAKLLIEIYSGISDEQLAYFDEQIAIYEEEIESYEQFITDYLASEYYDTLFNKLTSYTPEYNVDFMISCMLIGNYDNYLFETLFKDIASYIQMTEGDIANYIYRYDYSKNTKTLRRIEEIALEIYSNAYLANDQELFNFTFNNKEYMYDLWTVVYYRNLSYITNKELDEVENHKQIISSLKTLIDTDEEALLDTIEVVVNFLVDVYSGLDAELVYSILTALEVGLTDLQEIFIIKDELAHIFLEALPSVEEFETFYILVNTLTSMMYGVDDLLNTELINEFATLAHYGLKLELQLLLELDYETFTTIISLADNINETECGEIKGDYYCTSKFNPDNFISLILEVEEFLSNFSVKYASDIDSLTSVLTDDFEDRIFNVIQELLYTVLQNEAEEYFEISKVELDILFADRPYYTAAIKLLLGLGYDSFEHFINTEGKIILDYYQFIEVVMKESDLTALQTTLNTLLKDIVEYNGVIFDQLTLDDFTILVKGLAKYAKLYVLVSSGDITNTNNQLDALIDEKAPILAQILKELIAFEISFANNLSNFGITLIEFTNPDLFLEDNLVRDVIKVLANTLTEEQEAALLDAVELFYTEILTDEFLVELFGLEELPILEEIEGMITAYIDIIHEIANFDFNNLTSEQYEFYRQFLESLVIQTN